jgi:succinate-semialdehyde dehydrogenase / glutarate-semialdehyde dehydrogenase
MMYQSVDPTTEELWGEFPCATPQEVEASLARAEQGARQWRFVSVRERGALLARVADLLDRKAEEFAVLMAREMGKPRAEGIAEVRKCAATCRHYVENSEEYLRPVQLESDAGTSFVTHEPIGPVLAIMPWNFPFWQVFRFAAPALMAGNTVLLKHAPNTPQCALAIAGIFREVGYPAGVFENLFLDNDQAAGVIADRRVAGVTLTGSTAAGRAVAAVGGRALKPMVMELGGSDPFIVLDDADVETAARTAVTSRCLNSGQSCIAAKRFVVAAPVYTKFCEVFLAGMRGRVMGNPLDEGVTIGPMARCDLRDQVAAQVRATVEMGATILCGGTVPQRTGFFYPPTVLVNIPEHSPAFREELFGPVAAVFRVEDEEDMVSLANCTEYGLGASLWTSHPTRAAQWIPRLAAGAVFVNGLVKSDARLPFGGTKASGFGRELARDGMMEFVNRKTVWIAGN